MLTNNGIVLLLLAICMSSLMNIAQKSLVDHSTYRVYVVATGVGFLLALLGYYFLDSSSRAMSFSWWMIVLGIAVALLNFSFIRIYQSGGQVSTVTLVVTGGVTLVLAIVGGLYFGEIMTVKQYVGIAVILLGLRLTVG